MASSWKPIDTAPRDGTNVILGWDFAGVWLVRNGWWDDGCSACGDCPCDEDDIGWWSYRHSVTQELLNGYDEPTHWLPLPKPPTVGES